MSPEHTVSVMCHTTKRRETKPKDELNPDKATIRHVGRISLRVKRAIKSKYSNTNMKKKRGEPRRQEGNKSNKYYKDMSCSYPQISTVGVVTVWDGGSRF